MIKGIKHLLPEGDAVVIRNDERILHLLRDHWIVIFVLALAIAARFAMTAGRGLDHVGTGTVIVQPVEERP